MASGYCIGPQGLHRNDMSRSHSSKRNTHQSYPPKDHRSITECPGRRSLIRRFCKLQRCLLSVLQQSPELWRRLKRWSPCPPNATGRYVPLPLTERRSQENLQALQQCPDLQLTSCFVWKRQIWCQGAKEGKEEPGWVPDRLWTPSAVKKTKKDGSIVILGFPLKQRSGSVLSWLLSPTFSFSVSEGLQSLVIKMQAPWLSLWCLFYQHHVVNTLGDATEDRNLQGM